jgi:methyl-accepting chemotaxis protein
MSIFNWFNSLTIRNKIFMLVILGILGVAGISGFAKYSAVKKNNYMTVLQQSRTVEAVMLQIMMAEEKFINTLASEDLSGLEQYRRKLNEALTQIKSFDVGGGIADDAALVSKIETEHTQVFQMAAEALNSMSRSRSDLFAKIALINNSLKSIIEALEKEEAFLITQGETLPLDKDGLRKDVSDVLVLLSDKVLNVQELMLNAESSKFQETRRNIEKKLDLKKKNISLLLLGLKEFIRPWQASEPLLTEIARIENAIFDQWSKNKELQKPLQSTAAQIQEKSKRISESSKAIIEASNGSSDRISLAVSLCGILILSVLGTFISISINRSLGKSIAGLIDGAEQVASASGQVSTSSQHLAEGASRQRASLEDTLSSLEEVSAMVRQNAENASQANRLMAEARQVVGKANQSMLQLTESMGQISKANLETQKIIKTIDEIAFQTNLLALNAAVEAARAGEFGAGFAVVADEVRNLAMRAAEAAKNTADIIEGTVKTVKEGSALVVTTSQEFNSVATAVSKSGELIGEIAEASKEQAAGISQVNTAVSDLDKVVASNAASAEESAAAAEEMNSQAEQMKAHVNELEALAEGAKEKRKVKSWGSTDGSEGSTAPGIKTEHDCSGGIHPATFVSAEKEIRSDLRVEKGNGKHDQTSEIEPRPEELIPFDEAEISDF